MLHLGCLSASSRCPREAGQVTCPRTMVSKAWGWDISQAIWLFNRSLN